MDGIAFQDKMSRGMGRAAGKIGTDYQVYRPRGISKPLQSRHRIITLPASFSGATAQAPRYGAPVWQGNFDTLYTQPGDYLYGALGTFFIVSQAVGAPTQCVLTNRLVSIVRATAPAGGAYGGLYGSAVETVISDWPASSLSKSRSGATEAGERRAVELSTWTLLLPALPAELRVGDVVKDDLAQTFAIAAAEQSTLGWRIAMRQIGA